MGVDHLLSSLDSGPFLVERIHPEWNLDRFPGPIDCEIFPSISQLANQGCQLLFFEAGQILVELSIWKCLRGMNGQSALRANLRLNKLRYTSY